VVNPTGVFGPDDEAQSRINTMLLAMFRGRLPALLDGGFDWVDVRDVVSGMVAAEAKGRTGENYLLAGHHLTLRELSEVAESVSGVPSPKVVLPMWLARMGSPVSNVVSRRTNNPLWYTSESLHALRFDPTVSRTKAGNELAYRPRPAEETVRDIYQWAVRQGLLGPTK
jgi:dihydroflavonol-4-reductase